MSYSFHASRCLVATGVILVAIAPVKLGAQQPLFPDVKVQFARPGGAPLALADSMRISVGEQRVEVATRTSLEALLRAHGIYPDGESFAAVYRLNPGLRVPTVEAGNTVSLPRVVAPGSVENAMREGYLAYLTLDPTLKEALAARIRAMPRLTQAVARLPADRLGGADARDEIEGALRRLNDFALAVGLAMQERTRSADSDVLGQIDAEFAVVESALGDVVHGGTLGAEGRAKIIAAAEQVDARMGYWTESHGPALALAPYPKVWLEISVLRDSAAVAGLRVYYASPATPMESHPFPTLTTATSPVRAELDVANWIVWAGKPGDSTPLTDKLEVKLRTRADGGPYAAQLMVVNR